ncbi:NAD(P)-dependent oxidoreductase [Enterovirga rhinocerotis]
MTIGFIGLGAMGSRIAARLTKTEHALVVCDIDPERTAPLRALGATVAASPRDVATAADLVFTSLPTPAVYLDVLVGPGGVIEGGRARIVVDLSTIGASAAARAGEALAARSIKLIDAPVSGGAHGAEHGTLTIMVSGDKPAFETVRPVLAHIGPKTFYLGDKPGLAQSMKLVNNMLAAVGAVASFETLVMGHRAGLGAQEMLDVVNVSSGRNFATLEKIPRSVLSGAFPPGFSTELLLKDVTLGIAEAEKLGVPLWMTHAARDFLAFAVTQGDGPKDYAATIQHFEGWAGTELRS